MKWNIQNLTGSADDANFTLFLSTVFPDCIISRTAPTRKEEKAGVSEKDFMYYTYTEKYTERSWCEKKNSQMTKTRRTQAEPLHRLLCAPLLPKRINHDGDCFVDGRNIFTYLKIPFYHWVRLLREEIAQEPLDQFCGRLKHCLLNLDQSDCSSFSGCPFWSCFLRSDSFPPHPGPYLQSGFWQGKKEVFCSCLAKAAVCW